MSLKVDPGGYRAMSALLKRGFTVSCDSILKLKFRTLPTSKAGSYAGEVTNERISPVAGSITTMLPR